MEVYSGQKGQWMRHYKSGCDAFLVKITGDGKRVHLYFPDINEIRCRWLNAFVPVPGLRPEGAIWWSDTEDKPCTGFIWWTDDLGDRWKIGSRGDNVPYQQG